MTNEIYYEICSWVMQRKAWKAINQSFLSDDKSPPSGACPWPADISLTHLPPYLC